MTLIDGVITKELKLISDERGWLMEIFRSDWKEFEKFGQVYLTTAYPGVVKAWHMHRLQNDNFTCIKGMMKVALYDPRKNSSTYKQINEFFIGEKNIMLISVPSFVYHGFKAIGTQTAYFINVPTLTYNYDEPDEFRLPPNTDKIPYDWIMEKGKKHG